MTATGAGTDVLLFLLTARRYPLVACLSEPLAFFRWHPGSITVQGGGGGVTLGYARAMGWFALMNGHPALAERILARQWLREMRNAGRFVSPTAAATRYGNVIGARTLVTAALAHIARRTRRAAADLFRWRVPVANRP
jgi:hypothetical protein